MRASSRETVEIREGKRCRNSMRFSCGRNAAGLLSH
jgi:hypothetical protein